jgi:hypothetical protein
VSSALEGWYVDPSTGTNLRFWNGTTWTDKVAPMPHQPVYSGEVDLFAAVAARASAGETDTAPNSDTVAEADTVPHSDTVPEADTVPDTDAAGEPAAETSEATLPDLDPAIEQTWLTRRELRARRGVDKELNDAPKHLPPIVPPTAVTMAEWEELEIPSLPVTSAEPDPVPESDGDPTQRRHRIIRMSVLLGILAVVSSVAVLTAGTL